MTDTPTPQFTEAQLAAARPIMVGAVLREIVAMLREQAIAKQGKERAA